MARTLEWFKKHTNSDIVQTNIKIDDDPSDVHGQDRNLSDASLTADALKRGATAWDETDLCAQLGTVMPAPTEE